MNKLRDKTVAELEELGYRIRLSKFDYATDREAVEDFKHILDEGSTVDKAEGPKSVWFETKIGGVDITHFKEDKKSEDILFSRDKYFVR